MLESAVCNMMFPNRSLYGQDCLDFGLTCENPILLYPHIPTRGQACGMSVQLGVYVPGLPCFDSKYVALLKQHFRLAHLTAICQPTSALLVPQNTDPSQQIERGPDTPLICTYKTLVISTGAVTSHAIFASSAVVPTRMSNRDPLSTTHCARSGSNTPNTRKSTLISTT